MSGLSLGLSLLIDTNRLTEAEPLIRRAVAIYEESLGMDHPDIAIGLNNLAGLLRDTNRLAEAEPLSRRHLTIFLEFSCCTGHDHPHLHAALKNYSILLEEMGLSEPDIRQRLNNLLEEYGMSLG